MTTISRATDLVAFNLRSGTSPNKAKSSHYEQIKPSNVRHCPYFKVSQISNTNCRPAQYRD